jgi:hypothetical protein
MSPKKEALETFDLDRAGGKFRNVKTTGSLILVLRWVYYSSGEVMTGLSFPVFSAGPRDKTSVALTLEAIQECR